MVKYELLTDLKHNGKLHKAGGLIEAGFEPEQEDSLVDAGVLKPYRERVVKTVAGKKTITPKAEAAPEAAPEDGQQAEQSTKETLLAEAKELGIVMNKNWTVKTMEKRIAKAKKDSEDSQ